MAKKLEKQLSSAKSITPRKNKVPSRINNSVLSHTRGGLDPKKLKKLDEKKEQLVRMVHEGGMDVLKQWLIENPQEAADLSWIDIPGLLLPGFDFSGVNLNAATLTGSDFSGGKFMGARLYGVVATKVNFRGCLFSGANMAAGLFMGADFSGAKLVGADLSAAVLTDANLTNANFEGAYMVGAYLVGAKLKGASFRGAVLTGAKFSPGVKIDTGIELLQESSPIEEEK